MTKNRSVQHLDQNVTRNLARPKNDVCILIYKYISRISIQNTDFDQYRSTISVQSVHESVMLNKKKLNKILTINPIIYTKLDQYNIIGSDSMIEASNKWLDNFFDLYAALSISRETTAPDLNMNVFPGPK